MSDEGVLLPEDMIDPIDETVAWVRTYGQRVLRALNLDESVNSNRQRPVTRAILLQDLYEEGEALVAIINRTDSKRSYLLSILGQNFIEGSQFRLKISVGTEDDNDELGETEPISAEASAIEVEAAIRSAFGFTIGRFDISVSIGNPYYDTQLVPNEEILEESGREDDPDAPLRSYVGCWFITFSKDIVLPSRFIQFKVDGSYPIMLEISEENPDVRMKGLSYISLRHTRDVDTFDRETVHDAIGITRPTPLRAGTVVTLTDFAGDGYGVTSSGYRDMDVDLTDNANFEDPPEDDE